jgi:hypothetical protein
VPRSVWTREKGGEQIDHGYLAVRGGEVLYEGDRWRLRAPAAAVSGLRIEPLVVDRYQTWHFVVLRLRGAKVMHELPFVRIGLPLRRLLWQGKRRQSRELQERLLALINRSLQ